MQHPSGPKSPFDPVTWIGGLALSDRGFHDKGTRTDPCYA